MPKPLFLLGHPIPTPERESNQRSTHARRTYFAVTACLLGLLIGNKILNCIHANSTQIVESNPTRELNHARTDLAARDISALEEELLRTESERKSCVDAVKSYYGLPANIDDARAWARQDPTSALVWAIGTQHDLANGPVPDSTDELQPNATKPLDPARDAALEIVCLKLAQTKPALAATLAEYASETRTSLFESIAGEWARQDESAAYQWAVAKPTSEERDRLLSRIVFVESQTHPEQAAAQVVQQISPGIVQNETAISVLYQWALRDANAAMAWANLFPQGAFRDRAVAEVRRIALTPRDHASKF